MGFWEIMAYMAGSFISMCIAIYATSLNDIFYAQCETGDMKFIKTGGQLSGVILRVPGYTVDDKFHIVEATGTQPEESWTVTLLGAHWIGIYPFRKIHNFEIETTKVNPSGSKPEEWITKIEKKPVDSLRHEFPRPFVFIDVEIKSGVSVNSLVMCKFQIVDPVLAIFKLKGDFFKQAEELVYAAYSARVNEFDSIIDFVKADKEEGSVFSQFFTRPNVITGADPKSFLDHPAVLNHALIKQVGIKLIGFSVSKIQSSNDEIIKAAAKEEVARLNAKALKVEADGKAVARGIEAGAERDFISKTVDAEIETLVMRLQAINASPDEITRAVTEMVKARALSKSTTLTTWVEKGNNATPTIPIKP